MKGLGQSGVSANRCEPHILGFDLTATRGCPVSAFLKPDVHVTFYFCVSGEFVYLIPVVVSAKSEAELRGRALQLCRILERTGAEIRDIATVAARNMDADKVRAVILASDAQELSGALRALGTGQKHTDLIRSTTTKTRSRVAFAYPGQGCQWMGMGRELLEASPVFRAEIEACESAMRPLVDWSLTEVISGAAGAETCHRIDVVQPSLFGVMAGLSAMWRHGGVSPAAVIGYSMGEVPAALMAGALSREDAAKAVVVWSKGLIKLGGKGTMAVIAASAATVAGWIAAAGLGLDIAGISGPRSTVVAGDPGELAELRRIGESAGHRVFPIDVEVAGHSRQMREISADVCAELVGLTPTDSVVPIYSTVTGGRIGGREMGAEYWPENISTTVQFESAVRAMVADDIDMIVEVSPHPVLAVGLVDIIESASGDVAVLDSLAKEDGGYDKFVASAARLFVDGIDVDWVALLTDMDGSPADISALSDALGEWEVDIESIAVDIATAETVKTTPINQRELRKIIVSVVEEVLGGTVPQADVDRLAFNELGMTSFGAVKLRTELNERLGLRLPVTVVFDHPSVGQLLERILVHTDADSDTSDFGTPYTVGDDVAIVSMACRLPGGVTTPDELWQLVIEGQDAISEFPDDRGWDLEALYDLDGRVGSTYARTGGFVDGAGDFDAEFFGISPREALAMDPQQRLMLQTSWEVLERAGIAPDSLRGSDVGVFAGVLAQDYGPRMHEASPDMQGHIITGSAPSVVSGRVAYALGFAGPAITIDTACSSSLVAMHLAAQSLRSGECSLAIAGGVTVMASPGVFLEMAKHRGLSPDGRCRAFADSASGTGFAEGVGVVLLERLSDARRLGHPVLAVLRGSAVNQDGASNGLSAPNGLAQQRVIRQALASAGLSTADVDVVEAHGTGTRLGDPIEAEALLATYGRNRTTDNPLWLGSIKSNLGHTQAAAGVTGVIKMVQAMRHGVLPPTLHVDEPSARVDWSIGAVELLRSPRKWPETGRSRRAGVSSFGISGTNAHVILEAPDVLEYPDSSDDTVGSDTGVVPWVLSARSQAGLAEQALRLLNFVTSEPGYAPADIGRTLATARSVMEHRAVVIGADSDELIAGVRALATGESASNLATGRAAARPETVWVFPGQGAQWQGMAVELLATSQPFRDKVHECALAFEPYLDWNVVDVLDDKAGAPSLSRVDVVQPALFAVMVGLAEVWRSVCPEPAAVVGHSQGEIAAAHVAGILGLDDAARIVCLRSQAWLSLVGQGGMAAVRLPIDDVRARLEKYGDALSIAAVNGPNAIVVAGAPDSLNELVAEVTADDFRAWIVQGIDTAGHSAQVDGLRDRLYSDLGPVCPLAGTIPMYSTVSGAEIAGTELDVDYWFDNMRKPVLFADAMRSLYSDGYRNFLEISAHPMLVPAVEALFDDPSVSANATLRRNIGGAEQMELAMATAFCHGTPVSWADRFGASAGMVFEVPTYAFARTRYWAPMTQSLDGDLRTLGELAKVGVRLEEHPLVGASFEQSSSGGRIFSHRISAADPRWVVDHALAANPLLPGTAFAEILWFVGTRIDRQLIEELTLEAPVLLSEGSEIEIQVAVGPEAASGAHPFEVYSRDSGGEDGPWQRNATGVLAVDRTQADGLVGHWPPVGAESVDVDGLYDELLARGYEYGPAFRNVVRAWRTADAAFAEVELSDETVESGYLLHPALFDASLHIFGLLGGAAESGRPRIPFAWRDVSLHVTGATRLRVRVELRNDDELTVDGFDYQGRPVVRVGSVRLREVGAATTTAAQVGRSLYRTSWQPLPNNSVIGDAGWAVIGDVPVQVRDTACEVFDSIETAAAAVLPRFVVVEAPSGAVGEPDAATARAIVKNTTVLLQNWLAADVTDRSTLIVLTSRAVSTDAGTTAISLAQSPIWGLVRSIQTEEPGRIAVVDLDPDDHESVADRLREIARSIEHDGNYQFAVRGAHVLVPRLQRCDAPESAVGSPWADAGTVLITGGSGLLGRLIARHLVREHGVRSLVLCSRSGPAAAGSDELAAELAELGARVAIVACDVADRDSLAAVIADIPADYPLTGVVHSAVVLRDGVLASVDPADIDAVFAPKIDAAVHLDELTSHLDLSAFVVFSSTAATLGTAGQSNYAAANAYLDALMWDRRRRGLPGQALAWGFWSERGASTTHLGDADVRRLARLGIAGITNAQGLAMFDAAVERLDSVVVPTNLNLPILRQLARTNEVPEVLRGLVGRALPTANAESVADGLAGRIADLPAAEGLAVVADVVRAEVAAVLGYTAGEEIDSGRAFSELGFDSLTAVDLRNRLGRATGLSLPVTTVFDYPTSDVLARFLLGELSGVEMPVSTVVRPAADDAIAIVSMACRLPGGVSTPEELWELVFDGRDAIGGLPDDRGWDLAGLFDPEGTRAGTTYAKGGGFLSDVGDFDADFFGISPREALAMDPQQRLLLESSWEVLERAGIAPDSLRGKDVGVFAGMLSADYSMVVDASTMSEGHIGVGTASSVASGRVAYVLGFEGPAISIDTACSSSLVAMHLAAQSLRSGECSLAIAGGVTVMSTPGMLVDFARQRGLAADGRCRAFAESADGTGLSEGVGLVLLERVSDARRLGHPVLAVLRGSAVNQDGAS
ncbi:SDR family NAD(P)-dependent oxidoreductase, partial [Nocardia sp. NPDC059195]|uniref:SDR family NAD(P)-dependent oxidoreductase n=1 Tax=Nocardia sp. NPDC059195 TaxID=3346765 RepID=UPI0036B824A4